MINLWHSSYTFPSFSIVFVDDIELAAPEQGQALKREFKNCDQDIVRGVCTTRLNCKPEKNRRICPMLGVTMQTMCAAHGPASIAKLHDRLEMM